MNRTLYTWHYANGYTTLYAKPQDACLIHWTVGETLGLP